MAKWVPFTALFGLVCLMVLPTPGVLGIVIGSLCILAIIVSSVVMLVDRLAEGILVRINRMKRRKASKPRRAVHAHSGMAKKV